MSTSSLIWVDGESGSLLPLPDRVLEFGDGLFETLLVERGRPLFPEAHWQRLQKGLRALGFPDCLDDVKSQLLRAIKSLAPEVESRAVVRVTVSRGQGRRGYAPPVNAPVRIIISVTPLPGAGTGLPPPATLIEANTRWGCQPLLAGIKHCNRIEQVLAAAEKQRAGADEALMRGQSGQLVSVSAGNLFLRLGDALHTPLLTECGIEGTRRRLLMERWAPAIGCPVVESELHLAELEAASEVFFTNSVWGLRPVTALGELSWGVGEVCRSLFQRYQEERI